MSLTRKIKRTTSKKSTGKLSAFNARLEKEAYANPYIRRVHRLHATGGWSSYPIRGREKGETT